MFEFAARLALYGLTAEHLEQAARLSPHLVGVVGMAHDLGAWTTKLNATASDLRGNVNAFAERLRRA